MAIINQVVSGGGTTPTGTKNITTNGTHDVAAYEYADVQVPTTAPAHYITKTVDADGYLISAPPFIDLTGVTKIGASALQGAYIGCDLLNTTTLDMSSVVDIAQSGCNNTFSYAKGFQYVNLSSLQHLYSNNAASMFYQCQSVVGVDLRSVVDITNGGAGSMFYYCPNLESVDLRSLDKIEGNQSARYMFQGCTKLTSINLSLLRLISGTYAFQNAFNGCTSLKNISLPALETISYNDAANGLCQGCTSLESADLSGLKTISGGQYAAANMFNGCTKLTTLLLTNLTNTGAQGYALNQVCKDCTSLTRVDFPSLTHTPANYALGWAFNNCTNLTTLYFYALTSSINYAWSGMLSGVTGCTVHFPMAMQTTMSSWGTVTSGFSGTNTTVLFDIVTSLTGADTNTYARQQKDSTNSATAWIYNDVLYYTSGTNEPVVGDTIYSDAACTTAVTTISAIA